jgi:hypothetical protein
VSTGIKGGVLRGLKRTVLGGGDIFLNTFVAEGDAIVALRTWEMLRSEKYKVRPFLFKGIASWPAQKVLIRT